MSKAAADHYNTRDWSKPHASLAKPITIRTDTLDQILTRNEVPDSFDLMVVDVEGSEEGILRQLLCSRWRPADR